MKDTNKKGKSDFEQKQKEIELQHKATVNKIKSEIWGDRLNFLQKMINLSDESKKDMQAQGVQAQPSSKPSPKAHALAQQSTKGKTQEDEKADSKTKNKDKSKKKSKKEKQDLIHKIDSQLAKLKSKNKSKGKETEQTKDVEDDDSLDMADIKTDQDYSAGSHYDLDADEYAVNHPEINYRLDNGFPKGGRGRRGRDGNDLYDIFKDFDRDGDGIVDDIDFEDAHFKENCNKNGFDPYDDNTFK